MNQTGCMEIDENAGAASEEELEELEHRFPFRVARQLDAASMNRKPVFVQKKRPFDFDCVVERGGSPASSPSNLPRVFKPVTKKTESGAKFTPKAQKGKYGLDSRMRALLKHSADYQRKDFHSLVDQNEHLKRMLAKQ